MAIFTLPLFTILNSDLALASRYSELVQEARMRKKVFGAIEQEWQRTADALHDTRGNQPVQRRRQRAQ